MMISELQRTLVACNWTLVQHWYFFTMMLSQLISELQRALAGCRRSRSASYNAPLSLATEHLCSTTEGSANLFKVARNMIVLFTMMPSQPISELQRALVACNWTLVQHNRRLWSNLLKVA